MNLEAGLLVDLIRCSRTCSFCDFLVKVLAQNQESDRPLVREDSSTLSLRRGRFSWSRGPTTDKNARAFSRFKVHVAYNPTLSQGTNSRTERTVYQIQVLRNENGSLLAKSPGIFGRPLKDTEANFDLIRCWITLCKDKHGVRCNDVSWTTMHQSVPFFFRLVDVESKCIRLGRLDWEYTTLSYVWGNKEMFKTTRHNLQSLQDTEGLEMHYYRLPKTIQDAILCTKRLGLRYLWVDSLCIVQDDESDKLRQIQNMGLIYSHAQATLIAAEGSNANSGLPGVRPESRSISQLSTSVGGLDFALTLPSPKAALAGSPWGSRGWTFQEFALSKRVLFFSRYQVYFQCRSDTWCEDTDFESRDASAIDHSYRHDTHDGY